MCSSSIVFSVRPIVSFVWPIVLLTNAIRLNESSYVNPLSSSLAISYPASSKVGSLLRMLTQPGAAGLMTHIVCQISLNRLHDQMHARNPQPHVRCLHM